MKVLKLTSILSLLLIINSNAFALELSTTFSSDAGWDAVRYCLGPGRPHADMDVGDLSGKQVLIPDYLNENISKLCAPLQTVVTDRTLFLDCQSVEITGMLKALGKVTFSFHCANL